MNLFVILIIMGALTFVGLCAFFQRKFTLIKAFLFANLSNILIFITMAMIWMISESDGYVQLSGIGVFALQVFLSVVASTLYFGYKSRTKA